MLKIKKIKAPIGDENVYGAFARIEEEAGLRK